MPSRIDIADLQKALSTGAHARLIGASRAEKQAWIDSLVADCGYHALSRDDRGIVRAYIQEVTGYSRAQMARYITAAIPKKVVVETVARNVFQLGRFHGVVALTSLMLLGVAVSVSRLAPMTGSLTFLNAENTVAGVVPRHAERSIVVTTDPGDGNGYVLFAMERTPVQADGPATAVVAASNPGELRLRVEARRAARIARTQSPIGGRGEQPVAQSLFDLLGSGGEGQVLTVKNGKVAWAFPNFTGTGRRPTQEGNGNDSDPLNDDLPPRRGGGGGGGGSESSGTATNTTIIQTIDSDEWTDAPGLVYLTDSAANVGIGTSTPSAKLEVVGSISGSSLKLTGLANCNTIDTDAAGNLVCGTDEGGVAGSNEVGMASFSGAVIRLADARYVNVGGDTMTGALAIDLAGTSAGVGLEVVETISGSVIFANRSLSTSGSLAWEGSASGASLYVASSINGAGLVDCDLSSQALKWDAATGRFSCGTVSTGSWSGTGALQTAFDARYVNQSGDTMTGALTINASSGLVGLEVIQTISGSTIFANRGLSTSGSLVWEDAASGSSLYVASSLRGSGLVDCDIAGTSKLLWDSSTGRFSCGTDADTDTNTTYAAGRGLALNGASFSLNDTITGALVRFNTVSGSTIYARSLVAASGSLAVDGTAYFNAAAPLKLTNAGFFGCTALETDADGDIVCGSDADTDTNTTYTAGQGLGLNGTVLSLNATITGSLLRFQSVSGSTLFATRSLVSSGSLAVENDAFFGGRVGIGTSTPTDTLAVVGGISGSYLNIDGWTVTRSLFAQEAISGSSLYVASSLRGSGLVDCDLSTSVLRWDETTGRFSCGTAVASNWSGTGALQTAFDARYVNVSGDTMTGSLEVGGTLSGASLVVADSMVGAGLTDCDAAGQTLSWDSATGRFGCGTDADTDTNTTYTAGKGLTLNGTSFSLNDTITGALVRFNTVSGSTIYAKSLVAASGSLAVDGTAFLNAAAPLKLTNAGFYGCTALETDADGDIVCGTDADTDTNTTYTAGQGLGLNGTTFSLNSTVSGSLLRFQTVSGSTILATRALASSGSFAVDGAASFNAGVALTAFTNCTALETDADGDIVCGSDGGGSTYTAGQGLALNGSVLVLNSTITGSLLEFQTVSGAVVYAERQLSVSGSTVLGEDGGDSIVFNGDIDSNVLLNANNTFSLGNSSNRWQNAFFVNANVGADFSVTGLTNMTGNVGIGVANTTTKAVLNVGGTISGTTVYATKSFSGAGLSDCDAAGSSKLMWDAATGRFSCGTDQTGGAGLVDHYVRASGDTMTGALVINVSGGTNTTVGLNVLNTISGAVLYVTDHITGPNSIIDIAGHVQPTINGFFTLGTNTNEWFQLYSNWGAFSSGLGIGTEISSSQAKLEVAGTASGRVIFAQNALRSSGSLVWEGAGSGQALNLAGGNVLVSSSGALVWNEAGANVDVRFEGDTQDSLLFLDASTDRVGIGTRNPDAALEIIGSASGSSLNAGGRNITSFGLQVANKNAMFFNSHIQLQDSVPTFTTDIYQDTTTTYFNNNAGNISFNANTNGNSNGVLIDTSGNVGLSTLTPDTKLHIVTAIQEDNSGALLVQATGGANGQFIVMNNNARVQVMAWENKGARIGTRTSPTGSGDINFTTDDNIRMLIKDNGNVGIGTTTPKSKLDVIGTISGALVTQNGAGNNFFMGKVGIGTTTPTSLLSIREAGAVANEGVMLAVNNDALGSGGGMIAMSTDQAGDANKYFMVLSSNMASAQDFEYTFTTNGTARADGAFTGGGADLAEYFRTNQPNLPKGTLIAIAGDGVKAAEGNSPLIGVVSTQPGLVANGGDAATDRATDPRYVLVGLVGQIPTRVTTNNGPIGIGDGITVSSVPGVGRKANVGEQIVGIAMQPYNGSGEGKIEVYVGQQSLAAQNSFTAMAEKLRTVEDLVAASSSGSSVDVTALSANILRGADERDQEIFRLVGEQVDSLESRLLALESQTGAVIREDASMEDLVAHTLWLHDTLAVDADARIAGDLYLEGSLVAHDLLIPGAFAVDGSLTAATMDVTGDADVHGTLTLHGPLVFGEGSSMVFGSGMTMADLVVERSLAVIGDVTVDGFARFLGDVAVEGELTVARQAGHLKVPLGATGATFAFEPPFRGTPVVTASPNKPVLYAVSVATSAGFTVSLAGPAETDITFSWVALIIPNDPSASQEAVSGMSFPVDDRGVPVSSSLQWNACIRGIPLFDASGIPYSCSRYHDQNTWEQPDLGIRFVWNDAVTPPYMQLPDGYVSTVTESSENVRAAIADVNGMQQSSSSDSSASSEAASSASSESSESSSPPAETSSSASSEPAIDGPALPEAESSSSAVSEAAPPAVEPPVEEPEPTTPPEEGIVE